MRIERALHKRPGVEWPVDHARSTGLPALDHPSLPQGQLIYAVGDIHGRADLLAALLAKIASDVARREGAERRTLVFLGDYIDRGPDSREVVDLLLTGLPSGFNTHFLKGNHEAIMLDFLEDPSSLAQWLANGADTTLHSYGVDVSALVRKSAVPEAWRRAFLASLPEAHRDFFDTLELAVSFGDYFFVHAGVRPGVPLDAQRPMDLIWIRSRFLGGTRISARSSCMATRQPRCLISAPIGSASIPARSSPTG